MPTFGSYERNINRMMSAGNTFFYGNSTYTIRISGKPTCRNGEPKTDIYVLAEDSHGREAEFKITFKKENADFLENKMSAERAEQLFGPNWKLTVCQSTILIKDEFLTRPLIYKQNHKRTGAGSITLGWKFELLNKPGGALSGTMRLSREQVLNVYSGTNLAADKRNALVNNQVIENSGVANFILINDSVKTTQEVIDNLVPIILYVEDHPRIYFACKALNYRTYQKKWDGDRPLSVFIDWKIENNRLKPNFIFLEPLVIKGNSVARNLENCLRQLGIQTTKDINQNNIYNENFVCGL